MSSSGDRIFELTESIQSVRMKDELLKISDRFKDLDDIYFTRNGDKVKDDFLDDEWKGKPSVRLCRLSDTDVCKLGRDILQKLGSGFSQSDIGALFLLAFQLRKEEHGVAHFVFPERDPLSSVNDVGYESLNEGTTSVNVMSPVPPPAENSFLASKNARGYAYLAASILRLFRRTPENLVRAWSQITNRYASFYGEPCPIRNVKPHLEVLSNIRRQFSGGNCLWEVTLYRILYMSNESNDSGDLKKFLYDSDLSYTGMHIVPIFFDLCTTINCSTLTLLSVLGGYKFRMAIRYLRKVVQLRDDKTEQHIRGMWRYGRIFHQGTFMSPLQTRSCPELVMMLACMLQHVDPSQGNLLAIKQLEDVSAEVRQKCIDRAGEAVRLVRDAQAKTDSQNSNTA